MIKRLLNYFNLNKKEHPNQGHKYAILIGERTFMADSYKIDHMTGYPEWEYNDKDTKMKCKKYEGWILEEFL